MEKDVAARIESLESHVALLEGIVRVMLQEIENGTIQETASQIAAAMPRLED